MNSTANHRINSRRVSRRRNERSLRTPNSVHPDTTELTDTLAPTQDSTPTNISATANFPEPISGNRSTLPTAFRFSLQARELDTLIRMRDPTTGQFIAFDRQTGWWARFPTASRADAAILTRFYEKLALKQSKNIQDYAQNRAVISGAIIGRKKE